MTLRWQHDLADIDWNALSELYRIAPLGEKSADGVDCSYICDVAVQIFRNRERAIRTALVESA